jgi:Family of unknown function (DUF5412)
MDFDADYKVEKKNTYKKALKVILIFGLLFSGIIAYGVYWVFFDWSRFKQELIAESTSPNGTYTVNAYLSNTHATTPYTVLGELVFNKDNKKSKRIYWEKSENAQIDWVNDSTVIINKVQLELPYETYDFRSGVK